MLLGACRLCRRCCSLLRRRAAGARARARRGSASMSCRRAADCGRAHRAQCMRACRRAGGRALARRRCARRHAWRVFGGLPAAWRLAVRLGACASVAASACRRRRLGRPSAARLASPARRRLAASIAVGCVCSAARPAFVLGDFGWRFCRRVRPCASRFRPASRACDCGRRRWRAPAPGAHRSDCGRARAPACSRRSPCRTARSCSRASPRW